MPLTRKVSIFNSFSRKRIIENHQIRPHRSSIIITAMAMAAAASRPSPPSWKLYHNPHFSSQDSPYEFLPPPLLKAASFPTATATADDLALARIQIGELRAELELERRLRRGAESLANALSRDLARERLARAEAEAEAARCRSAAREAEDERRMLKLSEAWREERVQMKLADAAVALEEKIREVNGNASAAAAPPPSGAGRAGLGRERENPHIKRGIKGFVEFPRAVRVRVRSPGSMGKDGNLLECQKAQLRVLLRQRNTAVNLGVVGDTDAPQPLVM